MNIRSAADPQDLKNVFDPLFLNRVPEIEIAIRIKNTENASSS
jgi:hypothetical protein